VRLAPTSVKLPDPDPKLERLGEPLEREDDA
jgi:hypothetical protein